MKAHSKAFFFSRSDFDLMAGLEEDTSLEEDSETSAAPTQSGFVKT